MRFATRLLFIGTVGLGLGGSLVAQRGFAGGHINAPANIATTPALRGLSPGGRPLSIPRNYPAPLGLRAPAAGYTGIRPGALRSRGGDYRHVPYAYFLTPYYYPSLDYGAAPYGGGPYDTLPEDPALQASFMAQSALGEQVHRLGAEVEQLKYGQQMQMTAPSQEYQPPQVPVTLVLRNGQQLQVQNYAVMNDTFWDFTSQPARRIALSTIDIAASTKATEAKGGEFPQIESGQ